MATARASLAGVLRRHSEQNAAIPSGFVFQLSPKLTPALVENGAV
tara:strand:- start:1329 stop:1463 length:135 start_codon:yes stop_codon:yes gene_type:complete